METSNIKSKLLNKKYDFNADDVKANRERGVIRYTEMSTRMRMTKSLIQMEVSYQSIATV